MRIAIHSNSCAPAELRVGTSHHPYSIGPFQFTESVAKEKGNAKSPVSSATAFSGSCR
jgi:hypothetical protein